MAIKYYSSIDLNQNELQKAVIENTTEPGSPVEGQQRESGSATAF